MELVILFLDFGLTSDFHERVHREPHFPEHPESLALYVNVRQQAKAEGQERKHPL